MRGLGHGRDDALLEQDAGLRDLLEGLLGLELRAQRQPQRALVLRLGLVDVRQLRCHVLLGLCIIVSEFDPCIYIFFLSFFCFCRYVMVGFGDGGF